MSAQAGVQPVASVPGPRPWLHPSRLLQAVLNVMLVLMVLVVIANVAGRALLPATFDFSEELAGYGLLGITALGCAISFRQGHLYRVDIFYGRFPPRVRRWADFAFNLVGLLVSVLLAWQCGRLVLSSLRKEMVSQTSLSIPLYLPQLLLPVGFAILSVAIAIALVRGHSGDGDGGGSHG